MHNFDDLEITTGSQLQSLWYDANHDRSFHLPVRKDLSRQRRRSWSWIISNLEQEVRRLQGLLEEVDSELNDMIRVTRRGYTFHETGVPPPPPQNQVSVFLIILQSCAYNVPKACKYQYLAGLRMVVGRVVVANTSS